MTRRRLFALAAALLLLAFAGSLHWVSRPRQFTALLLDRAGSALGLEITAAGVSEYRLRGLPRLVLRDVVARQPGAPDAILRARRVEIVLPWSTLRARGRELAAERIELDAPQLDLPALQRWLATRPATDTAPRIPQLRRGLAITQGTVHAGAWRVEALHARLPSLHPGMPAHAQVRGRVVSGTVRLPFDLTVAMTQPAAKAGVAARGSVDIETPGWRMPMRVRVAGRLASGADGLGLDGMRLGADARLEAGRTPQAFVLGVAGPLRIHAGAVSVRPLGLAVIGQGPVPTVQAQGRFGWHGDLDLDLDGTLAQWPDAWPALPAPLSRSRSKLGFELDYRGPLDFSGNTALTVRRDAALAELQFRLPQVLAWIDARPRDTPLPPLAGRVSARRLEMGGAVLEGVEVELHATPARDDAQQ